MGMSASQARLIALTARMSDVEYEGQQINQQRLILTNKMSEVYEQMVNMDVPTPPSKIDFAYPKYTGKLGNTNVSMRYNDDGVLKAYQEVKGSVVETTQGSKGAAADANPANFIKKDAVDTNIFKKPNTADYKEVVKDATSPNGLDEGYETICSGSYEVKWTESVNHAAGDLKPGSQTETWPEAGTHDEEKSATVTIEGEKSAADIEKEVYANKSYPEGATIDLSQTTKKYNGTKDIVGDFNSTKTYVKGGEEVSGVDIRAAIKAVDDLADKKYAIPENGSYRVVSGKELAESTGEIGQCYEITDLTKFEAAIKLGTSKQVTSADGKKTGSAIEISDAENLEGFGTAFEALKHTYTDLDETELKDKFYAVQYSDGSFAFVQKLDLDQGDNSVYIYEVGTGTYDQEIEASPTMDKNGNITGLKTTDGRSAVLNSTQGYDELAYDAAMATYTAEKVEYDREQNNLNKQTSIYQRQDKQLELKLKRLDTERNALNTEIDAVKKVIQDATDKGFKTFSG